MKRGFLSTSVKLNLQDLASSFSYSLFDFGEQIFLKNLMNAGAKSIFVCDDFLIIHSLKLLLEVASAGVPS